MVEIDPEKMKTVIDGMQGIVDDPFDIAVFIMLVAVIITAILFVHRRQVKKNRSRQISYAQSRFNKRIQDCKLNETEVEVLENMSGLLNDPQRVHHLVEKQSTFNNYASQLVHCTDFVGSTIAALRVKLGFKQHDPRQVLHSTAELNTDMPVLIVQNDRIVSHGNILHVKSRGVEIALDRAKLDSIPGLPIQVYFQTPTGQYGFPSYIQRSGRYTIEVSHSELITRTQRREFYRDLVQHPVKVRGLDDSQMAADTVTVELGGGGASIKNPGERFKTGDLIRLFFSYGEKDIIEINGEVVRLSHRRKIAHIEFDELSTCDRDRIITLLFRGLKSKRRL
jgi:hypothetical protein